MHWLRLDASALKQQLTGTCDAWVAAFSGLLATLASRQLGSLESELRSHCAALEGEGQQGRGEAAGPAGAPEQPGEGQAPAAGEGAECTAGPAGEASPGAALSREQQIEALEALHGRLKGEREGLQERLALCQERYEALVGLQVGAATGSGGPGRRGCLVVCEWACQQAWGGRHGAAGWRAHSAAQVRTTAC